MSVTREELAAFADGQLDAAREAEVAALVATDSALAEEVERHRSLKAMLAGHYAPIAEEPVPGRFAEMLAPKQKAEVVSFAAAKERHEERRRIPRWGWVAGSALAASLAIAVFLPRGADEVSPYADAQLAAVLDDTLVAEQSGDVGTRVLLSFQDDSGRYCRAFSGGEGGGIACREDAGWKLEAVGKGSEAAATDYRMAGADDGDILARAQEMASGGALDAAGEARAREAGWR
ncbi:MAG: anti-sigma factor family protein [Qipengyuania vulgaris]